MFYYRLVLSQKINSLTSNDLSQLAVNGSEDRNALVTGFEAITILIPRYAEVEAIYLDSDDESSDRRQLRNAIIELYANVLDYQIEVARYFATNSFGHYARAVFKLDDWNDRLQKIKDSDDKCKSLITVLDARFARSGVYMLRNGLNDLDESIRQQIAEITVSRNIVDWDPGPNTDPGHLSVLYGGSQGRASSFRIALADIQDDEQLFKCIRATYALRQHPLWRREVTHPIKPLVWLRWYDVQKIEYVKVGSWSSSFQGPGSY